MTEPSEPASADMPAAAPDDTPPTSEAIVWPPLETTMEQLTRLRSEDQILGVASQPVTLGFIDQLDEDDPARLELLAGLKANNERYSSMIEAARIVSQQAEDRYAAIQEKLGRRTIIPDVAVDPDAVFSLPRDMQLETMGEVRDEVAALAGVVASMAESVVPMLEVARDAREGLLSLVTVAGATRTETELLREALIEGQASADRAAKWLFRATVVLIVLTFVIAGLTVVLVFREGG